MPAVVIVLTQVLNNDRRTAILIGGFVPLGLNLIIQISSYVTQKCVNKSVSNMSKIAEILDDESCCGKKAFLFLFPARQSFSEILFVILLSGVYGALMTYFMHIQTMLILNRDPGENYNNIYYGLTIAVVALSSYSLFSKPMAESTPYLTSDSFSIFSSHYQRVGYSIFIAGCVCIAEFSARDNGTLMRLQGSFAIAYIVHFVVLVL